ncbi:NAD-dependent epimerase/dehydratase family protein [Legionella nagasakiensis]|uniref:NAD-dependent epimerase/dehydratase family protein n=1 Tax=Legionella nagasakiensis TaxID=535290 RepID=UPI0010568627|nr:NAD-dependent epimerase/dehydratase family protein [Legionella nagasakiensis]
MMCVVTGATGCLGLNLTRRLLKEGHEVVALGRNEQLGHILTQMGAKFRALDLSEPVRLQAITQEAKVIFHCAALSSPWGKYKDFYAANVVGTQHVIAATPPGARLVHVSTPSIYFDFSEKHNIKEDVILPLKPANHYVKTKLLAEALVDKAYQDNNLNVITIRPRAIFGPFDRAILPRLLSAERNGVLPVIGTGNNVIDITCVENVVDSLILAANAAPECCGNKYNITNDEPRSLQSILSSLFTALHKPLNIKLVPYALAKPIAFGLENLHRLFLLNSEPRLTKYTAAVLALGQTLNIEAAKKELGYRPKVTIDEGIRQFVQWYTS